VGAATVNQELLAMHGKHNTFYSPD
jgi:hypothetical protein